MAAVGGAEAWKQVRALASPEDPEEALESWVCSWPEPHFGRTPEAVGPGLLPSGASGKDSRVLEEAATPLREAGGWPEALPVVWSPQSFSLSVSTSHPFTGNQRLIERWGGWGWKVGTCFLSVF